MSIAVALSNFAPTTIDVGVGPNLADAGPLQRGIIVAPDSFMLASRQVIVSTVFRNRIPALYPDEGFADAGGIVSYAIDQVDLFRRCGNYVGRILNGESPTVLPVQTPTRFRLTVNLLAADRMGIPIPYQMLARADRVIE
jgi:putative ABC transport system substrate-binding protein